MISSMETSSVLSKTKRLITSKRYMFNILILMGFIFGSYVLFYAGIPVIGIDTASYQLQSSKTSISKHKSDKDHGIYSLKPAMLNSRLSQRNITQELKVRQNTNGDEDNKITNISDSVRDEKQNKSFLSEKQNNNDGRNANVKSKIRVKGISGNVDFENGVKTYNEKQETESFLNMTSQQQVPFISDQPRLIHLLGYQRTGSSFIGDILDRTPDIFSIYEPLLMLYDVMYGTGHNHVTPNAIFNTETGAIRTIPEKELKMVTWTLESIFTCQMSQFTAPMLLDPWWLRFASNMTHVPHYIQCLMRKKIYSTRITSKCLRAVTPEYCPYELHPESERGKMCFNMLVGDGKFRTSHDIKALNDSQVTKAFIKYTSCYEKYEKAAKQCAKEYLDTPCRQSSVRALKTVRASMPEVTHFLDNFPNYRIVHLFRDPRAVVRSRKLVPHWGQSDYEKYNVTRIAQLYCKDVLADYELGLALSKSHPGKMLQVLYDAVMENLIPNVRDMYQRFLGFDDIPEDTLRFIEKSNTKSNTGSKSVSLSSEERWRSAFTSYQISKINDMCKKFMEEIKYDWS